MKPEPIHRTRIDSPGPDVGFRQMRQAGMLTCVAAGLGFAIAPNNLLMSATLAAIGLGASRYAQRSLNNIAHVSAEFSARRRLPLDQTGIPYHRDEHGQIIVDPDKPWWEPDGVCYVREKETERIRVAEGREDIVPWYRDRVERDQEPVYRRQDDWCQRQYPERHNAVLFWWLSGFVLPTLERRWPMCEFRLDSIDEDDATGITKRSRYICLTRDRLAHADPDRPWREAPLEWCQEVASDHRRWRFEGMLLAISPKRWTRRIDQRPSMKPFSYLHHALLDLYDGVPPGNDAPLPDDHRVRFPNAADMYLGHGFRWEVRHIQKLHEMYGEDLPTGLTNSLDGDPRPYGTGAAEADAVFIPAKEFNTHLRLLGAPGAGKTRQLVLLSAQSVRNGASIVLIDPKLDRDSVNYIIHEARRYGRGNRVHVFHLNAPRCREISTYNPLFDYDMPDELAGRVGAAVTRTSDPFWHKVGVSSARAVLKLGDYVLRFMRLMGAEHRDGQWVQAERFSNTPPRVLLGITWAMYNPQAKATDVPIAVDAFLRKRKDPAWKPGKQDLGEIAMLDMCRMAFWSSKGWNPTFRPVNMFGVSNPETIVAWAIRVVYLHLWLQDRYKGERAANFPETLPVDQAVDAPVGQSGQARPDNWWSRYKAQTAHPLEILLSGAPVPPELARAVEIYQQFIPTDALASLRNDFDIFLEQLPSGLAGMRAKAIQERKEYTRHMTTLASSLDLFDNERDRLVNSLDPDIRLKKAIREGDIVLFVMNSMKDPEASEGFARVIVGDCLSYLGETYGVSAKGRYDFWLYIDEYGSFVNEYATKLLSQGRGAGVFGVVAGQSGADVIVSMSDVNKAHQLDDNLTMRATLRTASMRDAEEFAKGVGKRHIVVSGSRGLTTSPNYGGFSNKLGGSFSVSENRSWQEREVDLIPATCLTQLPTFQSFYYIKGHVYMVLGGLLPTPQTNILEEFCILQYEDNVPDPEIAVRRFRELDQTAQRLDLAMASPYFRETASRHQLELRNRYPQDRDRDAARTAFGEQPVYTDMSRRPSGANQDIRLGTQADLAKTATGASRQELPTTTSTTVVQPPKMAEIPPLSAVGTSDAALRDRAKIMVEHVVGRELDWSSATRPAVTPTTDASVPVDPPPAPNKPTTVAPDTRAGTDNVVHLELPPGPDQPSSEPPRHV